MAVKTLKDETAKVEAVKVEEVKKEEAVAAVKTEVKKPAAKKVAAKKPVAKKEEAKAEVKVAPKAASKAPAKKAAVKTQLFIQYYDKEVTPESIEEKVKAAWINETGKKVSDIKSIKIYVKPSENVAYYVINEDNLGHVVL